MEEKIELEYNEITETYEKISEAMRMSNEKKANIENMTVELYEETRPKMVEMREEDLEKAKSEKEEFDEMTKNALINIKKDILKLRKETEEKYNQKLLDTLEQKKRLEQRAVAVRKNMQEKGFDDEKIESVEDSRKAAEQKINESMIDFQNKHFEIRNKLDEYEKNITKFAVELDFVDELDKVQIEEPKKEKPEEKKPEEKKPEEKKPEEKKPEEKKTEEKKPEEKKTEEKKPEEKKPEEKKPEEVVISRIEIEEATGYVKIIDDNGQTIYDKQFEYDKENRDFNFADEYDIDIDDEKLEELSEKMKKIEKSLKDEYGEDVAAEKFEDIDTRVLFALGEIGDSYIEDYIWSIYEKDETMPFELEYNLKDIYDTDMSLEEIDEIKRFSKTAKKQNGEMVDVKKDNILKRAYGRIKKEIKERIDRKLLSSGEKPLSRKEKREKRKEDKKAQKETEKDMKKQFGKDWKQKAEEYEQRYGKDWKKYIDYMAEKHGEDWETKTRTSSEYKEATKETDKISRQGQKQFEAYLRNGGKEPIAIDHEAAKQKTTEVEPKETQPIEK